jgi:hypothetical protein
MFCHLFVHRDSLTLFILSSIKFLILIYWISSIILDYLRVTLSGFRFTYERDLRSFASLESFLLSSLCYLEHYKALSLSLPWDLSYSVFLLTTFVLKRSIPNFLFSDDLKIYRDINYVENCKPLQADTDSVQE